MCGFGLVGVFFLFGLFVSGFGFVFFRCAPCLSAVLGYVGRYAFE